MIEDRCEVLRRVSLGFGAESEEGEALRLAACALLFVQQLGKLEELMAYYQGVDKPLSQEQQDYINKLLD